MFLAGVAHPVERHLAKVEVASSSLVTRSIKKKDHTFVWSFFFMESGGGTMARKFKSNLPGAGWAPGRAPVPPCVLPKGKTAASLVTRSENTARLIWAHLCVILNSTNKNLSNRFAPHQRPPLTRGLSPKVTGGEKTTPQSACSADSSPDKGSLGRSRASVSNANLSNRFH